MVGRARGGRGEAPMTGTRRIIQIGFLLLTVFGVFLMRGNAGGKAGSRRRGLIMGTSQWRFQLETRVARIAGKRYEN